MKKCDGQTERQTEKQTWIGDRAVIYVKYTLKHHTTCWKWISPNLCHSMLKVNLFFLNNPRFNTMGKDMWLWSILRDLRGACVFEAYFTLNHWSFKTCCEYDNFFLWKLLLLVWGLMGGTGGENIRWIWNKMYVDEIYVKYIAENVYLSCNWVGLVHMLRVRMYVDEDTFRCMGSRFYCRYMIHVRTLKDKQTQILKSMH